MGRLGSSGRISTAFYEGSGLGSAAQSFSSEGSRPRGGIEQRILARQPCGILPRRDLHKARWRTSKN
eukprot:4633153-Pyramimonas_sp.AAC.1